VSYDLTLLRPPPGTAVADALEEFYEEQTDDWPEQTVTPAEERAVASVSAYGEVYREGTHALTLMLPFFDDPGQAAANLDGALPYLQTLIGVGYVVDDPQQGRLVGADELEALLRHAYVGLTADD
jgi:hypothetical protein